MGMLRGALPEAGSLIRTFSASMPITTIAWGVLTDQLGKLPVQTKMITGILAASRFLRIASDPL